MTSRRAISTLQSSHLPDPEHIDRHIESWTEQRVNHTRDELARASIDPQARNQGWWEALPMTYEDWDSEKRIPETPEDFARVDAFYFRTNPYLCTELDFDGFAGKKVLEIGCGAGSAACRFAQGHADVTAVDLTERATALTMAHAECLKVAVDVRQIDAEDLKGIPDATFDFVYSWGVLHHSEAPDRAYRQIARVLKPDGQYLVMVYHKASLRYVVRGLAHLLLKGKIFAGDTLETVQRHYTDGFYHRHYTRPELRLALEQAGLSVEKMDVTHMSSRMMPGLPAPVRAMLKRRWGWLLVARGTRSRRPMTAVTRGAERQASVFNLFQDFHANSDNPKGLLVMMMFRLAHLLRQNLVTFILFIPYFIFYRLFVEWMLCIELPWKTRVGPGFRIDHGQALVINNHTIFGRDCIVRNSTTIGIKRLKDGTYSAPPVFGDRVDIGANAVIVGPISIGDDVAISAGAVVLENVPARHVAIGNPARFIPRSLFTAKG